MDKISRYLLLLFIIIIFIILAPVIVIYVSGKNIQLGERLTKNTGIIDIQSNPSDAEVYIDGQKNNNTPATIRFVNQGTHHIEVRKAGFRTWQKNLFIEAGKVTYAGSLSDEVKLLPDEAPTLISDKTIESYVILNDSVIFHSGNNLTKYDLSDKQIKLQTELPIEISKLQLTHNDKYLLALTSGGKNILINTVDLKLTNLPEGLNSEVSSIDIDSSDNILGIKDKELVVSNLANAQLTPISKNILTFTLNNNLLYTVSQEGENLKIDTYLWDGVNLVQQSNLLTQKLALGKKYQIWLTYQKELFLLVDEDFYRVNKNLDLLNKGVKFVQLDKIHRQLTYQTLSEIYYYNFLSNRSELFYRTTQITEPSLVIPNTGYGFLASTAGLEAIEIDNRNGQNHYLLVEDGAVSNMSTNLEEDRILFLNNKKLYSIAIEQ
jgi:hypothetical protein